MNLKRENARLVGKNENSIELLEHQTTRIVFANVHYHYLRTRSVGFVEETMVDIEEINDTIMPSDERLLDAEEIEKAASTLSRPTAKLQLQTLAKKLRKEAAALKRVEASKAK